MVTGASKSRPTSPFAGAEGVPEIGFEDGDCFAMSPIFASSRPSLAPGFFGVVELKSLIALAFFMDIAVEPTESTPPRAANTIVVMA